MTKLLYLPIENPKQVESMRKYLQSQPVLDLVYQMINPDPSERPHISQVFWYLIIIYKIHSKVADQLIKVPHVPKKYTKEMMESSLYRGNVFTYENGVYGLDTVYHNVRDGLDILNKIMYFNKKIF